MKTRKGLRTKTGAKETNVTSIETRNTKTKEKSKTKTRRRKSVRSTDASDATDFYKSINGDWLEHTKIPKTETRITQAYAMQEDINAEIDAIIAKQTGSIEELLTSWVSTEGKIPIGITSLIQVMNTMTSTSDIMSRIGWMNRYGISPPLMLSIQGDPRDHRRCRVFIDEGRPMIGIPEYWIDPEYTAHRREYHRYVRRLARIIGIPQLLLGYEAEREFAHAFPKVDERKQRINMLTWTELCEEFRMINWKTLFTAWGLSESQLPDLVYNVNSLPFLHHIQRRITSWNIERWQGWFSLIATQWVAGNSPHGPLRSAWFDFACRFMQGAEADDSAKELRNRIVRAMMPNTVGKLWVAAHCDTALRRDIRHIVKTICTAAENTLRTTKWMTEATQKAAIRKLRTMDIQLCWPNMDIWDDSEMRCGLTRKSLLDNLMALNAQTTAVNQSMITSGNCRHPVGEGWSKPVFVVNAYYYPDENRFLLPAAILRPPFYDRRLSIPTNYGAIGATIGHELCHAFDSDGRSYDEHGDKRVWWSRHDDREYTRKARQVVRLFDSEEYRGMAVNGELTLIENIADLGGLEFALAGAKLAMGRDLTKAELREFFESYAISWRSKDRFKRAAQLLDSDMHAPPKLRVNHIVRQFDEWYEAFDVGPDSAAWIAPDKRIHFFA